MAYRHSIDPLRDYLEGLVWDGTPRMETCLPGVVPTEYTRLVARKVMTAAVARVLEPGIKWDHMLVIFGSEGLGKSMWIRFVLVPGQTDAPDNVEGIASFVATLPSVERVDVLPFHKMGAPKYEAIGLPFALADTPTPDAKLVERVRGQFLAHGLRA